MIRKLLTLILVATATLSFGQIPKTIFNEDTEEPYDSKDFSVSKLPLEKCTGIYSFGESEGEWSLVVLPYNGKIIIQIMEGFWGNDVRTGKMAWLRKCTTFNDVKVNGHKFQFGKFDGMFITYKVNNKQRVLLFADPTMNKLYGKDSAEVGHFDPDSKLFFDERTYPEISEKIIDEGYLAGKSKEELNYIRNEVFAYYGLIFKSAEMTAHFAKNKWYSPWRKNVDACLTSIEKQNIALIKQYEQNRLPRHL